MSHRLYVDTSQFRSPEGSPNLSFSGLGGCGSCRGLGEEVPPAAWPTKRSYWDTSQFRSPYRNGYYQDNSLFGLGAAPGFKPEVIEPEAVADMKTLGPDYAARYLDGLAPPPGTLVRDAEAATAQIPQWAWVAAAALAGYGAYRSYQTHKKSR